MRVSDWRDNLKRNRQGWGMDQELSSTAPESLHLEVSSTGGEAASEKRKAVVSWKQLGKAGALRRRKLASCLMVLLNIEMETTEGL